MAVVARPIARAAGTTGRPGPVRDGPEVISQPVNGVLLLYYQPLTAGAATISEHVGSIPQYSRFAVWPINTALGLPRRLSSLRFRTVVLHYSLFGPAPLFGSWPDGLNRDFLHYLDGCRDSHKVAFFQDEHHFCRARFEFLNTFAVNSVF